MRCTGNVPRRWANINCCIRGIGATVNSVFSSPWDFRATVVFGLTMGNFRKLEKKGRKFVVVAWHAVCGRQHVVAQHILLNTGVTTCELHFALYFLEWFFSRHSSQLAAGTIHPVLMDRLPALPPIHQLPRRQRLLAPS